ncbi:MAG: UpxY family transcription antiterminator [Ignavibacteria bacterium]|nr:UpxY family transcription antiterminator [Ignavibacteria bacterium]
MQENNDSKKWFVLQTKPRQEKTVLSQVEQKNIEVYVPFTERIRIWSDRKKKVQVPLFSGYVFVHGNEEERVRAVSNTVGAIKYIYFQNRPAVVSDREIELIKCSLIEPDKISIEETKIRKGDSIMVTHGVFKGMRGYVNEFRGKYKLTVNLEELSYSFSIILNSNEVSL